MSVWAGSFANLSPFSHAVPSRGCESPNQARAASRNSSAEEVSPLLPGPRRIGNPPLRDNCHKGFVIPTACSPVRGVVHRNKAKSNARSLKRASQKRPQFRNRPSQRFKEPFYNTDYSRRPSKPQFVLSEPLPYRRVDPGNGKTRAPKACERQDLELGSDPLPISALALGGICRC